MDSNIDACVSRSSHTASNLFEKALAKSMAKFQTEILAQHDAIVRSLKNDLGLMPNLVGGDVITAPHEGVDEVRSQASGNLSRPALKDCDVEVVNEPSEAEEELDKETIEKRKCFLKRIS